MAIPLRADYSAEQLRSAAKASKDAAQARRLLALASICEVTSVNMVHPRFAWIMSPAERG